MLGEITFDSIRTEFWNKHINDQIPFTDKMLKEFKEHMLCFIDDMGDEIIIKLYREIRLRKLLK